MKSAEIRAEFLDYFAQKGHKSVRSASLIPRHDPTLLFTNAGMVQFKGVFLGQEQRGYSRAASSQKCMRAGGKHSDIENVGHTRRHHTFFEMLGNFSFGDYFKREAIEFAWELLTVRFGLSADKLWVTVYEEDDEAAGLWQEAVGVSPDRIIRLGAADNFWQMANTGPCGPCSEILIDQGVDLGCGTPGCQAGCDCDRYLELWNLVFMQFNRDESGHLEPLPKPSIDTGMGLERLSAVMQGVDNNFDSDLFTGITSAISTLTGVKYGTGQATDTSIRVIADHARAASFLISDGLMPANDGRGYVLRRIIRRASRHARLLGTEEPVMYKVLEAVVSTMGDVYPELVEERGRAAKVLEMEEQRFSRTLQQGMRVFDDLLGGMKKSGEKVIPGDEVFKLYDTFGFPFDLARDIALDTGYEVDQKGFDEAMDAQRQRARASWVGQDEAISAVYREALGVAGKTEFVGYESTESEALVKAVAVAGKLVQQAAQGAEAEVFLDRTPFYGESGGQVGDKGAIEGDDVRCEVTATEKPLDGLHSHRVKVRSGTLRPGMKVTATVQAGHRAAVVRSHTATHLLQAALRSVLGEHVKQSGSLVQAERLRFDFTHFSAVSAEELEAVEDFVNDWIIEDIPVVSEVMDREAAVEAGAIALFGEKYGEHVRVVSIPGVSRELCGGTHERATGQTGVFVITHEGSVASGIRRIEALTGRAAFVHLRDRSRELKGIAQLLRTEEPLAEVRREQDRAKGLDRELQRKKAAQAKDLAGPLIQAARDVGGVKVISARADGLSAKDLRGLGDKVRDKMGTGVIVLASVHEGQAAIIAMVTKDISNTYHAGNILKLVAQAAGGRGGGKPEMAQGGTRETGKLDAALESAFQIVADAAP